MIGLNCKAYIDTDADYETPNWEEVTSIRDLTLALERAEADMSSRGGGGFEAVVGTLVKAPVNFNLIYDPADTLFAAIRDAFVNNTALPMAIMDGDITVEDVEGLRADFVVLKFETPQNLVEGCITSVSIKPTYRVDTGTGVTHPPEYVAVDGVGALVAI